MFFKKIFIPNGQKTEITAIEQWSVRWYSRYGEYSTDVRQECEFFISEDEAKLFAEQLKQAFKLVKCTSNNIVKIIKE